MKRLGLVLPLALVLVAALGITPHPAAAGSGCPLYIACMESESGACFCTGFVCNGRFICGTPVQHPE